MIFIFRHFNTILIDLGTVVEFNTTAGSVRRASTKPEKSALIIFTSQLFSTILIRAGSTKDAKTTVEGPRRTSTRLSDREPVARSGSGRGTINAEQLLPGPAKERESSRRANRNVRGEDQASTIRRQDEEITWLRERVRQLEQENKDLTKTSGLENSNAQAPGLPSRMFGGKRFDLLESGGNAGKYVQKTFEKVHCLGKYYEEWVILEELKLDFRGWGSSEGPSIHIGDMEFYEIKKGEHRGKFVQKVGPDSMVEFDGRQYIKWSVREKIVEKNLRLRI